jgi:hypothetical protein
LFQALRILFFTLLFSLPFSAQAWSDEDWFDPAYLEGLAMGTGTGLLGIPSAEVIPHNTLVAGLHRFNAKAGYGVFDVLEISASADLEGYTDLLNIPQKMSAQAKLRLLRQDQHFISLAGGVESPYFDSAGVYAPLFHPQQRGRPSWYGVATRTLSWLNGMAINAGYGSGAYQDQCFGGLAAVVFPGFLAMAEFDGVGTNVGARMMLSSQIKLDLGAYHLQSINPDQTLGQVLQHNIFFGITYTEAVQWGWF